MQTPFFIAFQSEKTIVIALAAIISLTFQNPQGKHVASLYVDCLKRDNTPSGSLEIAKDCIKRKIENGAVGDKLQWVPSEKKFSIIKSDGSTAPTWYSENIDSKLGGNYFLWLLAIAKPNLDIILDEQNKALVFGGKFNNKYSIWVWKPDIINKDAPPRELSFIDFVSGEEENREFILFLKQNDGYQYKKSRLPEMIRRWTTNPNEEFKVIAVLPDNCIQRNAYGIKKDCTDYAENPTAVFELDKTKNRPQCLSDALSNNNYNAPLHFLVKLQKKGLSDYNYEVWSASSETPAPFYKSHDFKNNKHIAWLTILCFACRVELDEFKNSAGVLFSVYACDNYILCVDENGSLLYSPVNLVDTTLQADFVNYLKRDKNFYISSIVHKLVKEWAENTSVKYIIKAFGDRALYNYPGDATDLADYLKLTNTSYSGNFSLLLKKTNDSKYYFRDAAGVPISSWFSGIASVDTADQWLAQLAALDNGVKLLNPGIDNYTFITSIPRDYLRAWKLNSPSEPTEYAPLKNLFDKGPGSIDIAIEYSKALRKNPGLYDAFLQEHISGHFAGNTDIIRQVYPQNFTVAGQSPFGAMGERILDPNSIMPMPLVETFSIGGKLLYLIEKDDGNFASYQSTGAQASTNLWFREVSNFKDPWLAWLCLADPGLEVIAAANGSDTTRVCMVSSANKGHLWSWVAKANPWLPPDQHQLIDGKKPFLLAGELMEGYVRKLPMQKSEAEQDFYLERADRPESFTLLDFLAYDRDSPGRVLLYRDNPAARKEIFRIADGLSHDPIGIYLVEGEWDENWSVLAQRYREDWRREEFKTQIARSTVSGLYAWFGITRLGLAKDNEVGVFLSQSFRDFPFTGLEQINKLIKLDGDLVYLPKEKNSGAMPSKEVLFDAWARENWKDTRLWRANPLGYFDRVNSK
ncbi:MAG: hypothetical protein J5I98_16860 [Phaeodactylibacter sp.]|nr:hypothetical protein [Phaeodactylibacter sp.]